MTWVKLDDKFWGHPKVITVGNEAAGAFARMLSYCGDHLTDGLIPRDTATFIARPKVLSTLEEYGFVHRNGVGYVIPDYLDFNPSREQVEEVQAARAEAGRKGGRRSK